MSDSVGPHRQQPIRLLCPWDSPGKNTGVGCHALLQGIFPTQGSNSHLLTSQALTGGFFTTSATWEAWWTHTSLFCSIEFPFFFSLVSVIRDYIWYSLKMFLNNNTVITGIYFNSPMYYPCQPRSGTWEESGQHVNCNLYYFSILFLASMWCLGSLKAKDSPFSSQGACCASVELLIINFAYRLQGGQNGYLNLPCNFHMSQRK